MAIYEQLLYITKALFRAMRVVREKQLVYSQKMPWR